MNNKQRYKVIKKQPKTEYYIRTIPILLPPLPKELEDEIEMYANHFFSKIENTYLRKVKSADREKLIKENYETI